MLARRSFLGSLIGLVAGAKFYADESIPKVTKEHPYYLMFHDLKSGFTIQAPGIKTIEPIKDKSENNFGFNFIAEPLEVLETMCINAIKLHKGNGEMVAGRTFQSVYMFKGDTFKATCNIQSPALLTLEELVYFMSKIPLNKRMS